MKNENTPLTLPALFESSVERFAGNPMIWQKSADVYTSTTYEEVRRLVHTFAAGLMKLGVGRGDRVALISEGRIEWVVAELGILYTGAVNVPLSVKLEEPADLQFRLSHSGCRMMVISGNHAAKARNLRGQLPELQHVVLLDGEDNPTAGEITMRTLMSQGAEWLATWKDEFDTRWRLILGTDPANICYTSGTVADPKGIILTHRNYTANIAQSTAMYPLPQSACTLLILPWDHAFAHTDGIYALSSTGGSFACVQVGKSPLETIRNIPLNIKETRPTLLLSVPALAKNFKKGIEAGVRAKGFAARALFNLGLNVARAYNLDGWNRGSGWRMLLKPVYSLFDAIVFSKVRQNFGGHLQYFVGGGALLDIELQRFFYAIGIPMYQGYGLTEAAPVISANTPQNHKLGSSGTIVPDLEIKIRDEQGKDLPVGSHGEIVVKGENVMAGYWKNDRATAETIRDGWLYTGDLGFMDSDGYLYVLGRAKSLLIGHDGEKYSPEGIEETIVGNSSVIDQMMLYNNQSAYTVALLVPNKEAIVRWLTKHGHGHTLAEPDGQKTALHLLESEIDAYRPGGKHAGLFPERWLPSTFAVLDDPFTEQNRFLNSTLKMVRGKIEKHYRERLDHMYTAEGRVVLNSKNVDAVARLGGF
jgi:long-chain acyl-CoA synthetase